jgi:acyl carrier protein
LGRRDTQVKILGHRIELGEIESVLAQFPGVQQVCTVVQAAQSEASGGKRLIAYYVASSAGEVNPAELKHFLATKLPAYMLPTSFVSMRAFPLTANGKIDRAALPAPVEGIASAQDSNGTDLEEKIAALLAKVLGASRVGLDENFFDLGGDSLLIVAVHSQLQKQLRREIQVTDLFEYVTVRSLASHFGKSAPKLPTFASAQEQARKQRDAFSKKRLVKEVTS